MAWVCSVMMVLPLLWSVDPLVVCWQVGAAVNLNPSIYGTVVNLLSVIANSLGSNKGIGAPPLLTLWWVITIAAAALGGTVCLSTMGLFFWVHPSLL